MKELIGKEVKIYPNDTYKKQGIIKEIQPYGFLFEITKAELGSGYTVGKLLFIGFGSNLTFEEV